MIGALVVKDMKLFFRNRFFAVVTVLGLVAYLIIYFLMPSQVDESLGMAFFLENPESSSLYEALTDEPDAYVFDSEAEMLTAMEETNDFFVGLSIPEESAAAIAKGEEVTLNAYYAPGVPAEAKQIFHDVLVMIANAANPEMLANFDRFQETEIVLGNDMSRAPLSMRDRFVPLLLMAIVIMEVFGLATLLTRDVENGTARALITGPLRLHQFFIAKVLIGMILAFGQLLILITIMGRLGTAPLLLLTTSLLGGFLMVGTAFLIAAISKDNMSVLAWGVVSFILYFIPGLSIMLPGLSTGWMEVIPSFFFVDSLHRILNFEAGWADVNRNLAMLFALGIGTLAIGSAVLRRRF